MNAEGQNPSISQDSQNNGSNVSGNQAVAEATKIEEINHGEKRSKINRWIPRRWEEWYNQVVILSTLGLKSNKELAEVYKVTEQQISNIRNTPQAELLRKHIHNTVLKNVEASSSIESLAAKSLERVAAVLNSDELFTAKTEFVTHLAMKFVSAKIEKKVEPSGNVTVQGNAVIFSAADGEAMRAAIAKSKEADLINSTKPIEPPLRLLRTGTDGKSA